jgi:ribosome-binding factor A
MDNRRQNKIGSLMNEAMTEILSREGRNIYGSTLVSITSVWVSSDLSIARFYFSIYNADSKEAVMLAMEDSKANLKRAMVPKIRNLRKMPEFEFFLDETLDQAAKIDALFKKIHEEDDKIKGENS